MVLSFKKDSFSLPILVEWNFLWISKTLANIYGEILRKLIIQFCSIKRSKRPLKPIIITRDAIQKEVFGMGYKNLPVMSIEEFYEERAQNGWYSKPAPSLQNYTIAAGNKTKNN